MERQEPIQEDDVDLETVQTSTSTVTTTEPTSPTYMSIISKIRPAEVLIISGLLLISILSLIMKLDWSKEIAISVVSGLLGFLRGSGDQHLQ
jgi:hypothetical protein